MTSPGWQIFTFGGTCLADATRIAHAADLTTDAVTGAGASTQVAVVVSAMGGATDERIRATRLASLAHGDYEGVIDASAGGRSPPTISSSLPRPARSSW